MGTEMGERRRRDGKKEGRKGDENDGDGIDRRVVKDKEGRLGIGK